MADVAKVFERRVIQLHRFESIFYVEVEVGAELVGAGVEQALLDHPKEDLERRFFFVRLKINNLNDDELADVVSVHEDCVGGAILHFLVEEVVSKLLDRLLVLFHYLIIYYEAEASCP